MLMSRKKLMFFLIILTIIITVIIPTLSDCGNMLFSYIVNMIYLNNSDIMILPSGFTNYVTISFITSFSIVVVFVSYHNKKLILPKAKLLVIVFLCSSFIFIISLFFTIFSYTRITTYGIMVNNITSHKYYQWKDINKVDFHCNTTRTGKYFFNHVEYLLYFNDNRFVNLADSVVFRSKFQEVEKYISKSIPHIKFISNKKLFLKYFSIDDQEYILTNFKNWNE